MLERLCNNLYDVFRPMIIHINHLETLAELCSIMKVEMLEEHAQNHGKFTQIHMKLAMLPEVLIEHEHAWYWFTLKA